MKHPLSAKLLSSLVWLRDLVGATVLLLVAGHFIIGGGAFVVQLVASLLPQDSEQAAASGDVRQNAPAYADDPDSSAFWLEHVKVVAAPKTRFEPYYHWRRKAFQGTFTSVSSDGVRATVKPAVSEGACRVFVFGGSTVWGTGCRDGETIPSRLQALLGPGYDVTNYGETGYVSAQELNYLLHQLSLGNVPDMVIFYDGVNDGYAGAYSPAIPRDPQNLREADRRRTRGKLPAFLELVNQTNYQAFLGLSRERAARKSMARWDETVLPQAADNAARVAELYEQHMVQVRALGEAYGFQSFFFWQPNLFSGTKKTISPFATAIIEEASPAWVETQRLVYLQARDRFRGREDEGVFFLGDILNHTPDPVYIDWCHLGPRGNEMIALAMYQRLAGPLAVDDL